MGCVADRLERSDEVASDDQSPAALGSMHLTDSWFAAADLGPMLEAMLRSSELDRDGLRDRHSGTA